VTDPNPRALLLRDVEVAGRPGLDVRVAGGRIAAIGRGLPRAGADELDGRGGALLPGLHDHHIHLLAAAARAGSIDVSPANAPDLGTLVGLLRAAAAGGPVRAVGYDDAATGRIDAAFLDRAGGGVPIRVQHRSGHAWVLGSAGRPPGVRTGPDGWVYGTDALPPAEPATGPGAGLSAEPGAGLGAGPTALGDLSRRLAGFGVTAVTDASPGNDANVIAHVGAARVRGELLQAVTLMGRGVPGGTDKIMLEESADWSLPGTVARIAAAHRAGRPVAVHCVSGAAVVFALTALDEAGPYPGDRLEHASVVDAALLPRLAAAGLSVVTQPGFLYERGDDYLDRVDPVDLPGLYRIGSLLAAGVPVAGSSDAPFGPEDPWLAMRTAVTRATRTGRVVGAAERITPEAALALYTGPTRGVHAGAPADVCLLRVPWREARAALAAEQVAATVVAGRVVHDAT
jgi:predicted amidohydrolase YtcJ